MSLNYKLKSFFTAECLFFYFLIFSAIMHFPFFYMKGDAVGLFDISIVMYAIFKIGKKSIDISKFKQFIWISLAYIGYLSISTIYSTSSISILLLIKQVEHFVFFIFLIDFYSKNEHRTEEHFLLFISLFAAAILYQVVNFYSLVPGPISNYRLGLPFKKGISSNPAGLFLSSFIVVLVFIGLRIKRYRWYFAALLVLSGFALVLTDSRTNMIGLLVVMFFAASIKIWSFKYGKIVLPLLYIIGFGGLYFLLWSVPDFGQFERFLKLLRNPLIVVQDTSFRVRLNGLWPSAVSAWTENLFTILLGKGYGFMPVVDGTYHRLLVNQGVIGFLFFMYLWFVYFIRKHYSKPLLFLLILVAINGIAVDTLITSYRSIQIFLIMLSGVLFFQLDSKRRYDEES